MPEFSNEARKIFIIGLRNAHAMENQALSIMKPQASRIENYPEVGARIEQHIEETRGQIARLDEILESLDENASTLKDTALSFMGTMAALGHAVAADEILKNSMANFAFENFEIAAYSSLLALAQYNGDSRVEAALRQNLEEEKAMAQWLDEHLPQITLRYAGLRAAGETAKI